MNKAAKTQRKSGISLDKNGIIVLDDMKNQSFSSDEDKPEAVTVAEKTADNDISADIPVNTYTDENADTVGERVVNKKKIVILSSVAAAIAIIGVAAGILIGMYNSKINSVIDKDSFYDGIIVEGVALGGKTMEQAKEILKKLEPTLRDDVDITVTYGDKVYSFTEDDFEFVYDTDKVLTKAYAVGREGSKKERYDRVLELAENPLNYSITAQVSDSNISKIVEKIKSDINYDAVESHVSNFVPFAAEGSKFTFVEGSNGISVNEEALTNSFASLLKGQVKKGTIEVTTTEIPYKYSIDDIRANTKFLSTFSTTSTNTSNGDRNMSLALSKVNGTILNPGEIFSFCGKTGNSNNGSLGYVEAGVISQGKLIQDFGGGICQASSTLYGAVIRADLGIISRSNHSWPSTYVPIGLDAAINYPGTDFKFINDTDFPIFIEAVMSGKKLTVNIYGAPSDEWDEIRVTSTKTSSTEPGNPTYIDDPTLAKGVTEIERSARTGYTASAEKIYYKNGTEVKRAALPNSNYKPITAIIRVGTGASAPAASGNTTTPKASSQAPASSVAPTPTPSQPSASSTAVTSSTPASSQPASSSEPESSSDVSEVTSSEPESDAE